MPTCCWISTQSASAPMRTRAIGLSATLTASAPCSWAIARALEHLGRAEAARRVHLDADHELAGAELLEQPGRLGRVLLASTPGRRAS